MDPSPPQRQVPARSGRDLQPVHPRLDQLLRPVLSQTATTDADAYRHLPDPLGALEVQAPARAAEGRKRMVGPGPPRQSQALVPLAVLQCRQPNIGSRVNREVPAPPNSCE